MSKGWSRSYFTGHVHRDLTASEYRVDTEHTVLILLRDNFYDSYIMWHDNQGHTSPFLFMFGHEAGTVPYSQIVDMTINAAPDYYSLFEED